MNIVVLKGRFTKDPQLKKTQSGKSVTSFTLAVQRTKEEADFINCVAYEKQADVIDRYCRKGKEVCVNGRIATRSYEDRQGAKHYITEVIVNNVEFTAEKKEEFKPKAEYAYSLTAEAEKDDISIDTNELPF